MKGIKERLLTSWADWSVLHYRKALLIAIGITILLGLGLTILKTEMTFFSVLPSQSKQVQDLERITEDFAFASQIMVVADARNIEDPVLAEEAVKRTLDALYEEFIDPEWDWILEGAIKGNDLDFIRRHGMMLTEAEDLDRLTRMFEDPDLVPFLTRLNDDYEREYAGNEENLEDDEQMAIAQIRGMGRIFGLMEEHLAGKEISEEELSEALDQYLLGETYLLSRDNRMGIMLLRPVFTMNDFFKLREIEQIEERAAEIAGEAGITAGLTGMIVVGKDEMVTSEQGLGVSMLIAFTLIILLLIVVFRMNSVPFIAGIPLLTGIFWAAGLTGFIVQRLNIITAMYMVALIGLGVDYAIHILAAYIQCRDRGDSFETSIRQAYRLSGPGIITGAMTTAAAFLALIFSTTEMISELGLVAGMGILCEMMAMLILIPPLLAFRHNRLLKKGKPDTIHSRKVRIRSDLAAGLGRLVVKRTGILVLVILTAGILLATQAGKVSIEDNIMNMEAKGLESIELQDTLVEEFGMAPDGMLILTDDPEEISGLVDSLDDLDSVKSVEGLSWFLPNEEEYAERLPLVREFADSLGSTGESGPVAPDLFLEEIFRLEMNLIEMGDMAYLGQMHRLSHELNVLTGLDEDGIKTDESVFDRILAEVEEGDPARLESFQSLFRPLLLERLRDMSGTERITEEMLPALARDSYISRDGGSYIISINPRQNPWEGEFRSIFTTQVASVTDRGTGMILAADQLNEMATTDGVFASILAVIIVFILLLLDFRNLKMTLLTFVPLLMSFLTLFGIMAVADIKFDFVNIIAIPLLIGIGIDHAVHINHRYLEEGKGKMEKVIGATGTAIFLASVTTMIGFGSFIPSIMRAMRSTGIVLVIAMALAFVYSVILHPGLLIFLREKAGLSFTPWKRGERDVNSVENHDDKENKE